MTVTYTALSTAKYILGSYVCLVSTSMDPFTVAENLALRDPRFTDNMESFPFRTQGEICSLWKATWYWFSFCEAAEELSYPASGGYHSVQGCKGIVAAPASLPFWSPEPAVWPGEREVLPRRPLWPSWLLEAVGSWHNLEQPEACSKLC